MGIRIFSLGLLLVVAWTVMTFTHEMGHILAGWSCGGTLVSADLLPWRLPQSFFEPDPKPLITLWSGPIFGALVPILGAALIRRNWAWFVASFCLLANGLYIATGWIAGDRYLDSIRLLEHGASRAALTAYSVATLVPGYQMFRRSVLRVLKSDTANTKPQKQVQ